VGSDLCLPRHLGTWVAEHMALGLTGLSSLVPSQLLSERTGSSDCRTQGRRRLFPFYLLVEVENSQSRSWGSPTVLLSSA
jgi:hypothetical protein